MEKLATKRENQIINYQSERHCTLSGRNLGMGSAVTYLCRQDLWAFADASEEDELTVPSVWPRPWNLAKRLITENLSRSWHSTLRSETDVLLSNLHHHQQANKTNEYISAPNMFYHWTYYAKDDASKQTLYPHDQVPANSIVLVVMSISLLETCF